MSANGSSSSGPCGACKFLRRKCVSGCIFAPYFDSEDGAGQFAAVHKVFGASNVSKLLLQMPAYKRLDAVITICYEAQARLQDPVYGCVANIFALQQQVVNLQAEIASMQARLATTADVPSPPLHHPLHLSSPLAVLDLPSASALSPTTYDLLTPEPLDPPQLQHPWSLQQQLTDRHGSSPPSNK